MNMKKWKIMPALVLAVCMFVTLFGGSATTEAMTKVEPASYGTISDFSSIEENLTALQFTKTKKKIKAGKTYKFKVNKTGVTWSVSNKKLAKISKKGVFTAKKCGSVKVSAALGTEKVTFKVKITPKAVIGIDPGHQKSANTGTEPVGPGSSTMKTKVAGGTYGNSSGLKEYELTLQVSLKLKKELENRGYKVVMTRESHDVNITNKERAEKLNESCDIAIRIHADGAGSSSARGATALYPSSSNPYVGNLSAKSKTLSECVLGRYCESTGIKYRGLSARDDLTGTNWSTIPVTLIELGFMTNPSEDVYMANSANQETMAEGIANGVDDYFKK